MHIDHYHSMNSSQYSTFPIHVYRGYRTRRELRMRPVLPTAHGLNAPVAASNLPTPILYEGWIAADEKGLNAGPDWDIKVRLYRYVRLKSRLTLFLFSLNRSIYHYLPLETISRLQSLQFGQ